jgi:hypothetical protein
MMPDTHDLGRLFVHSVQLDPGAPIVHKAFTAEYDDPCRHSPTLVIKTPLRRRGRWHGIRKSWISVQVKLPTGEAVPGMRWGIVAGWWRFSKTLDEWSALLKAVRMGREPDGDDDTNYEAPTSASIRDSLIDVDRRRVDADGLPGADGQ